MKNSNSFQFGEKITAMAYRNVVKNLKIRINDSDFRLSYIFFFFFSQFYLIKGLRVTALCGVFGTCIGAWVKVLSVDPQLFYVGFIGQSVVAVSQVSLNLTENNGNLSYCAIRQIKAYIFRTI